MGRIRDPQNTLLGHPTRLIPIDYLLHLRCSVRDLLRSPHSAFRRSQNASTGLHTFTKLFASGIEVARFDYPASYARYQDRGVQCIDGGFDGQVRKSGACLWVDDCQLRGRGQVVKWRIKGAVVPRSESGSFCSTLSRLAIHALRALHSYGMGGSQQRVHCSLLMTQCPSYDNDL